ncbi:sulfhydryl oxidase 2 [Prorops nasuta]|uniref:sulfhydryl oxidase 2 n=1 Tax=Prorops nasuta TaxID=863751 RepID=UPI0034CF522B
MEIRLKMERSRLINLVGLLLTNIILFNHYSKAAVPKQPYENLAPDHGLYNSSDNVTVLNVTTFNLNIYSSNRGWLVEFYNSWCGFCFRFAPVWKSFATDIVSWRDIVEVAAIDCFDDENNGLCREHEIMHYPMIKYFPVNLPPSSMGLPLEKDNSIENMRHRLIDILEKEQQEGRGSSWPNITPYRNSEIIDIWKTLSPKIKHFFLFFERTDSHLGVELILDLHGITNIQIRRVTTSNEPLCIVHKIIKFPSLVAFDHTGNKRLINVATPSREGVRQAIREYLIDVGINLDEQLAAIERYSKLNPVAPKIATEKPEKEDEIMLQQIQEDKLFQRDIENALRFSLNREISLRQVIKEDKFKALFLYINVLADYFPIRHDSQFLNAVRDEIKNKTSITGREFKELIKSKEKLHPPYSGPGEWIACKGSSEQYRGYPCGLWTMFHTLTVNFGIQSEYNHNKDPALILKAMYGYIKNFFGCADCSQHFVSMSEKNKLFGVRSGNENILWLWRAHNEVNARLSGDETEDPEHKKIQYPTDERCSNCKYENGTWNERDVLRYLKHKYSYGNISYLGASGNYVDKNEIKVETPVTLSGGSRSIGWDFNIFDISICVVLYALSALIIVLVCVKFALKRTYKKKIYVSLLGKV